MIEIILKEPVEHLGSRGDIVKVAPGYARNYLLPRGLALKVTAGNRRQVEHMKKVAVVKEAEERSAAEALAARLSAVVCVIARRVGDTDTLYGSVTASDIADVLAAQQVVVDRRKIQLPEPIKVLGDFSVPIKVYSGVVAQIRVQVVKDA
jgi:large subunit ribosomal protein L9